MKKLAVVLMALGVLGSAAIGAPIKTSRVAGDAKWVAHADVEAMIACDVGQFVTGEAKKMPHFDLAMLAFRKVFGFDPLKDVRGVTAYGKDFTSHTGVAVIDCTVNEKDLVDLAKTCKSYKQVTYGKYVLHQLASEHHGKTHTGVGCLYDKDTLILSNSVDLVQNAIDVLDGKAASLAKTDALKNLPASVSGSLVVAAAQGFPAPKRGPGAALFQDVTGAAMQIWDANGKMSLTISLTTKTPEAAENIREIARGFVALGKLMKNLERFKAVRGLGEEIKISGEGATAQMDASIPTASIIKIMQQMAAKAKEFRAKMRGPGREGPRMMRPRWHGPESGAPKEKKAQK